MKWYEAAKYLEETYDTVVDYDQEYFICPECQEPIYFDDYPEVPDEYCPICECPWWFLYLADIVPIQDN